MRYLANFDLRELDIEETEVLVVGSGIAGLTAAFELAPYFKTTVLSKSSLSDTATWYAQGGIASAISKEDSVELHYQDTVKAGAGLCDPKVVRTIISESLGAISFLRNLGTQFDHQANELRLALEGGHSRARILHKRDFTGSEVQEKLVKAVLKKKGIEMVENAFSIDLLTDGERCVGLLAKKKNKEWAIMAKAVILATGGAGQLYNVTTNPAISTGDGIAMAYRAGAELSDMEFVQFHPTSLHTNKNPRFLITEALRGEGAHLKDKKGNRFLADIDEAAELAPRDIVARGIFDKIESQKEDHVFVDATHLRAESLINNYPSIYKACSEAGYDITKEPVPVSPAAHFIIGGIKTDVNGLTSLKDLYASGECASTGFHGANRLASNSLLEGVVLSRRVARYIQKIGLDDVKIKNAHSSRNTNDFTSSPANLKRKIQKIMWQKVGLMREEKKLKEALRDIKNINIEINRSSLSSYSHYELANLAILAQLVTESALWRKESRGVHLCKDYPEIDDGLASHRVIQKNA